MSEELSFLPTVSRRDFLAYCGAIATLIGLGKSATLDVAEALAQLARRPSVVWSSFQVCTGCAINLLESRSPDPATLILQQISLDYQDNVMAAAGTAAEQLFEQATARDFYWIVEGSIPTKPPEALQIAGRTAADIAKETYPKATAVIAIGSCSSYGNIQASRPNPTGAMGVGEYLRGEGGIPNARVINSPRCPGHGEDTIAILASILVTGDLPELDAVGRPLFLFGETVHDNCERRGHFEAGEFVETFGDAGSQNDWCLYKVGCKGPVTHAPCPKLRWNGHLSWPVDSGGPCIGCAEPDFWDELTPFYDKAPGIRLPGDVSAETVGYVVGGAAAVGIGAHLIGQAATGRLGKGGPPEETKGSEGGER
ncbi:MAG: twin-arginine translocation signal domain-containing protein [Actinobacteria bacterium]|nr:MAG: twin-arginine translocation signal domain-containing protein [Actinomycetota bacterium]